MFKQAATNRTIVPAILAIAAVPAVAADPTAVPPILVAPAVAAVPAVPKAMLYGGFCNMIENYSADNLKIAMINASVTWGDNSFTMQKPQTIREMTIANGLATTPSNLKPSKSREVLHFPLSMEKHIAP